MELVINISEETYNGIKKNGYIYDEEVEDVALSIIGGTPLPKGHGRLIDADALNNGLREQQKSYEHTFGIRQPINEAVRDGITISICHIDNAPTIIEVHNVESEE